MKAFIALTLASVVSAAIGAFGSWVTARILLPEMGLTAPSFGAWFWAMLIIVLMRQLLAVIASWDD